MQQELVYWITTTTKTGNDRCIPLPTAPEGYMYDTETMVSLSDDMYVKQIMLVRVARAKAVRAGCVDSRIQHEEVISYLFELRPGLLADERIFPSR